MNLLIIKAGNVANTNYSIPNWDRAKELGYTINKNGTPDVIISMSISNMKEALDTIRRFPNAKLFCYNWDCYKWVWNTPRPGEYDYNKYGGLLKQATEVWVPSECTGKRTTEWWGITNWHTIRSAVPYWEYNNVKDTGYALCTLRQIPDPHWDWFERACDELQIPWRMTNHKCSYGAYQEAVANCSFLVSHCYELSTGGLTLMEGYYLGKPCLLSDSPWHGGRDYMQDKATYFKHNNYEDFKSKLLQMHNEPRLLNTTKCKEFILDNYTDQHMVDAMLARIEEHCNVLTKN